MYFNSDLLPAHGEDVIIKMSSPLPGVGVFGTGHATKQIVPLLRTEGFHIDALWGQVEAEAEQLAKYLAIPFSTNQIDQVLLRKNVHQHGIITLCTTVSNEQCNRSALISETYLFLQS